MAAAAAGGAPGPAGKGPASSAAATGAGRGAGAGIGAWWAGLVSSHRPAVERRVKQAVTSIQKAKLAMPVDVKVLPMTRCMPLSACFVCGWG